MTRSPGVPERLGLKTPEDPAGAIGATCLEEITWK